MYLHFICESFYQQCVAKALVVKVEVQQSTHLEKKTHPENLWCNTHVNNTLFKKNT